MDPIRTLRTPLLRNVAVAALITAAVLTGCGSDDGSVSNTTSSTTTEASTTTDTPATTEAPTTTAAAETTTTEAPSTTTPGLEPTPGALTLDGPSPLSFGDDLDEALALVGGDAEPICGTGDLSSGALVTVDGLTLRFDGDGDLVAYYVSSGAWTTPEGIGVGMDPNEALGLDARLADAGDTTALVRDGIPTDMLMTVRDGEITEISVSSKLDLYPDIGFC